MCKLCECVCIIALISLTLLPIGENSGIICFVKPKSHETEHCVWEQNASPDQILSCLVRSVSDAAKH